ncbi:MAG: NAD(+) kinase [Methanomicrobiales archaeon HGW-Methanomicrobiales-5]|jgi:NAD+ kinase|nr:MAG: NAD(+) kinase [Methanomicrobiales archaeon HGW-Methanomicrobiales-5]
MRLILVSRIDNADAIAYLRNVKKVLEQDGVEVFFDMDTAVVLGETGVPLADTTADAVIIVGGDGTILRTIQQMCHPVPVIGINYGEVGFLADLDPSNAIDFVRTLSRGFSVEERMRITLSGDGICLGTALNEALIVTTRPAKMLRFSIIVDGITTEQFRADGLLISTPTGSTAYAMSAGGPIVDPRIQGFILVPLAPYLLSSRPHIISSDRRLEVRLESTKPANLVIDGQQTIELGTSMTIEVKPARFPARFVDVGRNFFEKVDNKLRKL